MSFENASNLNKSVTPLPGFCLATGAQKPVTKNYLDAALMILLGSDFRREDELLYL
jgi:hypothetical protein